MEKVFGFPPKRRYATCAAHLDFSVSSWCAIYQMHCSSSSKTSAADGWLEDRVYLVGPSSHNNAANPVGGKRGFLSDCPVAGNVLDEPSHSPKGQTDILPMGAALMEGGCDNTAGVGHSEKIPSALVSNDQQTLECLASIAYMTGSPLQRSQPTAAEPVQEALYVVRKLLQRGVNLDQIVNVIESGNKSSDKVDTML